MSLIFDPIILLANEHSKYSNEALTKATIKKNIKPAEWDSYMTQLMNNFEFEYEQMTIHKNDFNPISDSINNDLSEKFHSALQTHNFFDAEGKPHTILDENGYVNLSTKNNILSIDNLKIVIQGMHSLTNEDIQKLLTFITNIQKNKDKDHEIFKPNTFQSDDLNIKISEDQSNDIWNRLVEKKTLNEFGLLLINKKSTTFDNTIDTALEGLGLSKEQKDHIIKTLKLNPDITYYSFQNAIKNILNQNDESDSELPSPGVYIPKEHRPTISEKLNEEEYLTLKTMALIEWQLFFINYKSIVKKRKKSDSDRKTKKRENEKDFQEFLNRLEANNKKLRQKKK